MLFPFPGNLPDPWIDPRSPALVDSLPSEPAGKSVFGLNLAHDRERERERPLSSVICDQRSWELAVLE